MAGDGLGCAVALIGGVGPEGSGGGSGGPVPTVTGDGFGSPGPNVASDGSGGPVHLVIGGSGAMTVHASGSGPSRRPACVTQPSLQSSS